MYMIIIYKEPYVLLIKQKKKKNHKNCMKSTDQQPSTKPNDSTAIAPPPR